MSYRKQMKRALLAGVATATFAVAIPAISSTTAYAQDYTTGILRGTVQDTTGAVIAGATVTISSTKGVNRTAVTGADGTIRMPRLPVGNYTVTVTHRGHETLANQNIYISVGEGSGVTFTMAIPDSTIEEIVVSGTQTGNWDFNSTTTGISVNVGELFDKTPIARTATSVALLAPGTGLGDTAFADDEYGSQGNNASFSGSSVGENAYYINGLNITNFRNMVGGSTIPFEFYEMMEVKTGGYQAEYGRSTGGVINAVTKSGSNELHFGANVFWEPGSMFEQSPDTFTNQNHLDKRSQTEYNFWASGAIVEDKLFFYGLYNPRNINQLDCDTKRCEDITRSDPFYGVKIDFVPFDGHRLEYTYFSDNQSANTRVSQVDNDNDKVGALVGDSTFRNGGSNHIYRYTGTFTDWFTLSAMYGENTYDRTYDNDTDIPSILEFRNGAPGDQTGFDPSIVNLTSGADTRKAYRIDADFYFNMAGEHHIRVGWDQEKLRAVEDQRYNGNAALRYYDNAGSSTGQRFRVRQYWNQGDFSTTQSAAYIQDSWQVLDNLTLTLGVRNETFDNRNADGDTFVKMSNQVAPRFGFSWDPMNDGANKVYGSWGRYYLPVATNTNIRMAGRELYVQQFFELPTDWDQDTPYISATHISAADLADHLENGTQLSWVTADGAPLVQMGGTTVYGDGLLKTLSQTTDANLDPMYQDEWILGAEHDFGNGWNVGLQYVHRKLGVLIEDVAIDAAVIPWADANGLDSSAYTGFHQYVLTNPGSDMTITTAGILDMDGNPADQEVTFTAEELNYPEGKRTYDAVNFTFEREWDGVWQLQGSYTWSRSKGNTEGTVKSDNGQDDAGLTTDFDQPGLTDGAYGFLPNHRTHRFKLWGSYQVTDWMNVGALLNVESPRKQGCIGEHYTDYFAWAYGANSWYCDDELTPRGESMETDWTKNLDLSINLTPAISDEMPGELSFRVDVFNVFNSAAVADRWEFGDQGYTGYNAYGLFTNQPQYTGPGQTVADPDYGKPTRFQNPRRIRFSASYKF